MTKITSLSCDLETYSSVDLSKCGVYKYVQADDFEILLFGYSVDGGPVTVIDLAQDEEMPEEILHALTDETVTKWAWNASFERVCLSTWLRGHYPHDFSGYGDPDDTTGGYLDPASWKCTMTWAAYLGLPLSLDAAGNALHLTEQKMGEGKNLIRFFSVARKPTKYNPAARNYPADAPDRWQTFKEYNKRDVEVEMQIQQRLVKFPMPDFLWDEYHLSERINDRGIGIDMELVRQAILFDAKSQDQLTTTMRRLTGLQNPNSVQQMKQWLAENDMEMESLGKKEVAQVLQTAPESLKTVLSLRQQLAKSSVKKYAAMQNTVCKDGRARGMFQFYGANRTGRFAGRIIQLQNLPQNHMADLEQARGLVKSGDYETVSMLYEDVPDTLSQLVRTAFVPGAGCKFIVADFSAIEARVIAWLAGERWRMEAFANGEDIYCASASRMFRVPVEKNGVNAHLRQKGKVAELALGYGGSVGALKAMGALDMGIPEEELQSLVDSWRSANTSIVQLWWDVDRAVKECIKDRISTKAHGLRFSYQSGMMFITLPSGRQLAYVKPRIGTNRFGGDAVTYMGIGVTKKWERLESYGPKFVENIVQGISRDILCHAMKTLRGYRIVAHVHDELIIECPSDASVENICEKMASCPEWADGLLLSADGYECEFYQKK